MARPKRKIKIVKLTSLAGIKIGFYVPSKQSLFVSPAVHALIVDDLEMMRKHLTVHKMPVSPSGRDKFDSIEDWVLDLVERNVDIFSKEGSV